MIKKAIYILLLFIAATITLAVVAFIIWYKISTYKEITFRFEDYHIAGELEKSAESAKNALLSLYPIGTPVKTFLEALKKTDTECMPSTLDSKVPHTLVYTCTVRSGDMFAPPATRTDWVVELTQENSLIQNLEITLYTTKKYTDYTNIRFRFEQYSDPKDAETALLKLHPAGTPVKDLEKTLMKAGASCSYNSNEYGDFLNCHYTQKGFFSYDKSVAAKFNKNKEIELIVSASYINLP